MPTDVPLVSGPAPGSLVFEPRFRRELRACRAITRQRLSRRMRLPDLAGARNWQGQAASGGVLESCHGLLGVGRVSHRSTHSTNAGGISLRTIITRAMRSSCRSVAVPSLAASSVG